MNKMDERKPLIILFSSMPYGERDFPPRGDKMVAPTMLPKEKRNNFPRRKELNCPKVKVQYG
jgi:hypothetical protein